MKDNYLLQRVYDETHNGLDIITDLLSAVDDAVINLKKAFRLRTDERTPSAHLYPPDQKRPYWHVKDFGCGEGGGLFSPIDLYMWDRGYSQDKFRMALEELAERYNVQELLTSSTNKPDMEQREARPDEIGAMPRITLFEGLGGIDLSCWGANVKAEHLETYGWKAASEVAITYGDKVFVRKPTPTYPIFAQQCDYVDEQGQLQTFYKVYEPRNPDKAHRFLIVGKKPQQNYIYGMQAVRQRFQEQGEEKLPVLLLVSGGSDAVTALSYGYLAVWLDSETKGLSYFDYNLLMKYTKWLVNIPDIDATGIKAGRQLALTYLGIHTAWLTQVDMGGLHDNRGRQCKDLRDYCRLNPSKKAMDTLVNRAVKAKFWSMHENKQGQKEYTLSLTSLNYFLELNGFYTLKDESRKEPVYIHIDGIIVQRITAKTIVAFLKRWMEQQALPKALQDKVLRSRDLPTNNVSTLRERDDLDFSRATATSQRFYFRNCWVEVTAEKMTVHRYSESDGHYVWQDSIIQHDYTTMPDMFTVTTDEDSIYHIAIDWQAKSNLLRFLFNSSRIHWRKQDELKQELTPEEKSEEEQCLIAKMLNMGYMLHQYKSSSEAKATLCLDYAMTDNDDDANGRSGKSFYIDALTQMTVKYFEIDGRSMDRKTNMQFVYAGVDDTTAIIKVDECSKDFNFEFFFGQITNNITVENKGKAPVVIPFSKAPKFIFATNYVLKKHNPSTDARIWPVLFSDYYHKRCAKNDYLEDRSIHDDFKHDLMREDYSESDWKADFHLMMKCLQFYLSLPNGERQMMPPLTRIERRELQATLGKDFRQWAEENLSEGSEYLDTDVRVDDLYNMFKQETRSQWSPAWFTKTLKKWCEFATHIDCYNPVSVTGLKKDGDRWQKRENNSDKRVNYCYIQTTAKAAENNLPEQPPVEADLPF